MIFIVTSFLVRWLGVYLCVSPSLTQKHGYTVSRKTQAWRVWQFKLQETQTLKGIHRTLLWWKDTTVLMQVTSVTTTASKSSHSLYYCNNSGRRLCVMWTINLWFWGWQCFWFTVTTLVVSFPAAALLFPLKIFTNLCVPPAQQQMTDSQCSGAFSSQIFPSGVSRDKKQS